MLCMVLSRLRRTGPLILVLLSSLVLIDCRYFSRDRYIKYSDGTDIYTESPALSRSAVAFGYIPFNSKVVLIDEGAEYSQVHSGRQIGWIATGALDRERQNTERFTNSLTPVSIRDVADDDGREIELLDNNMPVRVLTTVRGKSAEPMFGSTVWSKVKFEKGEGWIRNRNLGTAKQDYFFFVSSYSGLNMRESPALTSRVIRLMPFSTSGKIIKRKREETTIDSRNGFWFFGQFQGQEGWVFSGFTLIASDLKWLTEGMAASNEIGFKKFLDEQIELETISEARFLALKQDFPNVRNSETTYFEIHDLSITLRDQCDQKQRSALVFMNKKTGVYFLAPGGLQESIHGTGPFPDSIQSTAMFCVCCCPWTENRTYFLMQDTVRMLPFHAATGSSNASNGSCNYGPVTFYSWGTTYVKASETRLLGHLKFPNCVDEVENTGKVTMAGGSFATKSFRHELFMTVDYDPARNFLNISKVYDQGIPENQKEVWENSQ
ncbi:MAG: hypothetical protein JNM27_16985 [Leptospirales bacterium]|nr:hypothetical protein [Leptospirales bacterium]